MPCGWIEVVKINAASRDFVCQSSESGIMNRALFKIQSEKLQGQYRITKQYLGENDIHSSPRPTGWFTLVSFGRNFLACPQWDSDLVIDLEKFNE